MRPGMILTWPELKAALLEAGYDRVITLAGTLDITGWVGPYGSPTWRGLVRTDYRVTDYAAPRGYPGEQVLGVWGFLRGGEDVWTAP